VRIFNSLYIEQKLHNTNPDVDVVVDALKKEGIKPMVALSLAKRYSKQRIREVINACRKQSDVKNKAGFIVQGLKSEWEFQGVRIEESPRYKTFVRPKELPDRSGYKQGVQMLREKIGLLNR
jgi:ribonuclease I